MVISKLRNSDFARRLKTTKEKLYLKTTEKWYQLIHCQHFSTFISKVCCDISIEKYVIIPEVYKRKTIKMQKKNATNIIKHFLKFGRKNLFFFPFDKHCYVHSCVTVKRVGGDKNYSFKKRDKCDLYVLIPYSPVK